MFLRKNRLSKNLDKLSSKKFPRLIPKSLSPIPKSSQDEIVQLNSKREYIDATKTIIKLGLTGHHDLTKNWDLLLSIENAGRFSKFDKCLDAGSGSKAIFGQTMLELGYRNIYSCDLQESRIKGVRSTVCDIVKTPYKANYFSLIACLSVVEHGVDLRKFAREMYRICKPGGELMISTDFWSKAEDHSNKFPYGTNNPPMKLFNNESLKNFIQILQEEKWKVPLFKDFSELSERPVHWARMNARYTFVWFKVKKQ